MTLNGMCLTIARAMQQTSALNDGHYVKDVCDFTDYDTECIETYRNSLVRLFMGANGRKWDDVLSNIRSMSPDGFYIGFKAQDKIIAVCGKYGIKFA